MGAVSNKNSHNSDKSNEKKIKEYPKWHNMAAGATAGAGARLLTAPLDLLKIRRQLGASPTHTAAATAIPRIPSPFGLFTSLKHIVQTEGGLPSLFRGNLAATYLWIGYAAVQFSLYARTSEMLTHYGNVPPLMLDPAAATVHRSNPANVFTSTLHKIGSNPTAVAFCSGAAAGTAATLATYPFDICRTAFAMRGLSVPAEGAVTATSTTTKASIQSFFSLAASKGMKTLFAGSGPAVLGIIPYMGLNFALYDYLLRNRHQRGGVGESGVAGAIAGGTSKLMVYPLDTVKKRLQAQAFETFWGNAHVKEIGVVRSERFPSKPYQNMVDCALRIWKEEGIASFYRGLVPTVMKSMAATGFTFAVYTMTKNTLETVYDWRCDKDHSIRKGISD